MTFNLWVHVWQWLHRQHFVYEDAIKRNWFHLMGLNKFKKALKQYLYLIVERNGDACFKKNLCCFYLFHQPLNRTLWDMRRIRLCCLQKQLRHYGRQDVTRHWIWTCLDALLSQLLDSAGVCVHPKQTKARIAYSLCQIHQFIPAHLNWQTETKSRLVLDQNFMKRNV